jgi:hypothetical protein
MRILPVCSLLLASVFSTPQTLSQLRSLYGSPDRERFAVPPDINVTVEYGSDGRAYHAFIETLMEPGGSPLASSDQLARVLDELVPPNTRGAGSPAQVTHSGCKATESTSYENVTISWITYCDPDGGLDVQDVDVTFKGPTRPTSTELHARYGQPESERFQARPGIALTVDYGPDDSACGMLITSRENLSAETDGGRLRFDNDSRDRPTHYLKMVDEILNEAVPESTRGEAGPAMTTQAGCGLIGNADYGNVSISREGNACVWGGIRVRVTFKRAICLLPRK